MDPREHWESVYTTRAPTEVSWYQPAAVTSLRLVRQVAPDRSAAIIDVGGGASTLVDGLVAEGYCNLTVLDVSAAALAVASARLAGDAPRVAWLEANVLDAALPARAYDVWHDRAVFHFLTRAADRRRYVARVRASVRRPAHVIVATFAPDGPARCSGLGVARYSPEALHAELGSDFDLLDSTREEHRTPAGAVQPFVYCVLRLKESTGRS